MRERITGESEGLVSELEKDRKGMEAVVPDLVENLDDIKSKRHKLSQEIKEEKIKSVEKPLGKIKSLLETARNTRVKLEEHLQFDTRGFLKIGGGGGDGKSVGGNGGAWIEKLFQKKRQLDRSMELVEGLGTAPTGDIDNKSALKGDNKSALKSWRFVYDDFFKRVGKLIL